MSKTRFRERFVGREFWRTINRGIFIGVYSLLVFGVMLFPMYLGWIGLGLAVVLPSYVAFFINYLRNVERERKGDSVIGGWIEHYHKVGEQYDIYVADIQPIERLSETDLKALDNYIDDIMKKAKQGKKKTILQLTYEEEIEEKKTLLKEKEDRNQYENETGKVSYQHGELTDEFIKWTEDRKTDESTELKETTEQKGELEDEKETV